ncbi:MAG: anthranilate synthase component I [Bacteroidetes bacterium]|nr:anthranilate synthase component I [Bacteroidota bacterium]
MVDVFSVFESTVAAQREKGVDRFVVPVSRRKSADLLTPVSAFLLLRNSSEYAFLLESVEGGEKLARFSFLGREPYRILRAEGDSVTILDASGKATFRNQNVFEVLKEQIGEYEEVYVSGLPRFSCGAVGYLSYDTVRILEHLPNVPHDDLNIPEGIWAFYDTIAAFDHVTHQLVLMSSVFVDPETNLKVAFEDAEAKIDTLEADLSGSSLPQTAPINLKGKVSSNVERSLFEDSVERAKKYIYEGDIFQVVLSQRFEIPFEGDPFNLYRALRQVNPSPYLFYLEFPEFTLVGSSPEVLVRVEGKKAEVLPIAGTRPRGQTEEEDLRFEQELLEDPKERAEHLMLVDLGRNDLSRISTFGSVEVDRYAYVERFSHVMHIVSSVSATVREDADSIDVLAACFPAGTVSGAPKVRAMEIIDELETSRRGIYAGTVGYVNFSGDLDTCITIRTILVRKDTAYVQAGAGIVADSDPAREFDETQNKALALHRAIQMAATELL